MEWIVKFIDKYFDVVAVIGLLGFSSKYLIQKTIDSYFNKQLENHKRELAVITENAKYDIHKKLFDFEAYASKRHSVYPELYRLVFESWDELWRLSNRFKWGIEDIKSSIDEDELNSSFDERIAKFRDKIDKASDYFYKNELYLSESITIAYKGAVDKLHSLEHQTTISFFFNSSDPNWRKPYFKLVENEEELQQTEKKIRILKETIYKELSYTHTDAAE